MGAAWLVRRAEQTAVLDDVRSRPLRLDRGPLPPPSGVSVRGDTCLPAAYYYLPMNGSRVPGGVVHRLPADPRSVLIANAAALDAWKDITSLSRNEFICWVEDAKQQTTRERRMRRTKQELEEGKRRPCCWPGCRHRDRTGRPRPA
jgi:hypothetical protein